MASRWCTVESDPAVFTELVQTVGVKAVSVEEIVVLEASELEKFENVYGLIFLFKWSKAAKESATNTVGTVVKDAPLYFAKQTIRDACATVAIINTVCNYGEKVDLGDAMSNFLAFTQDLDPESRGMHIEDFEPIRAAHNSFAPHQTFEMEKAEAKADDDVYHFVSFVYKSGCIWQLDGLQEGPIMCTDATDADYKAKMVEVVQRAIEDVATKDTAGTGQGISFALMAVVDDPLAKLEEKIAALRAEEKPVGADLTEELAALKEVREEGRKENVRRRHNYLPTVVALLKALAEKGQLAPIIEEVKAATKAK